MEDKKRVKRPMERRKNRPDVEITVPPSTEAIKIRIKHGKREDQLDAPPGTTIDRPATTAAEFSAAST